MSRAVDPSLKIKTVLVISTSSSLAYAVSILPNGKMHDLQGGSSSSQKSRFAAILGALFLSRVGERVLRAAYQLQTLLPCSEHLLRSVQDLSARFARSG